MTICENNGLKIQSCRSRNFEVITEFHRFIKVKKDINTPIGTLSYLLLCIWTPVVSKELESWAIVKAEEKHSIINLGFVCKLSLETIWKIFNFPKFFTKLKLYPNIFKSFLHCMTHDSTRNLLSTLF